MAVTRSMTRAENYISLLIEFLTKRISSSTLGPPLILYGDEYQTDYSRNLLPFIEDEVEYIISIAPSYGGGESRIESTPIEITNKTWCRISIGYNDNYEKIIKGLNEIFLPF